MDKQYVAFVCRMVSTTQKLCKEEILETAEGSKMRAWFDKLLHVRTIAPAKDSHAKQLSTKETLYEVMCMYHKFSYCVLA